MKKYFILSLLVIISHVCYLCGAHAEENVRHTPIVKVVKEHSPSVVNISTEKIAMLQYRPYWKQYGNVLDSSINQLPGVNIGATKLKGVGSGVVVSKDGLIVTNAHVINMANKIYVIMYNGESYEAILIAANEKDDLALIKITPKTDLKPIEFSSDVMIGETVVSIGNSFGLENSVSAGIISGTNRKFSYGNNIIFDDLIQTDAPINIGSSGGALLNMEGKLAGINLAIIQNAQSLGFAIPAVKVKKILQEYETYKSQQKNIVKIPVQ